MPRLIQVEKGSLVAAVFSTSGGIGRECEKLLRQIYNYEVEPEERREIL